MLSLPCTATGTSSDEPTVWVQLIDNPRFDEEALVGETGGAPALVPWWRTARGVEQLVERDGATWLGSAGSLKAHQPFAAYGPLVESIVVRGRMSGRGRVVVTDGRGARVRFELDSGPTAGAVEEFEFRPASLEPFASLAPSPRFLLTLEADAGDAAWWTDIRVEVELPCPDEGALREEIIVHLDWFFGEWTERSLDRVGPRETQFVCRYYDVVSGEPAGIGAGGMSSLYFVLFDALEAREDPAWRRRLDEFVDDYLELGLHPGTGLPCGWNVEKDVPENERPREVHVALRFLLDLFERGPERTRERALAHAVAIGEHVLAEGVLPDGNIAPGYRPGNGRPATGYPPLRRLDVPAQLARLGAFTGDERFTAAAREAVGTFEFTHLWHGTWDVIDPGFDDEFGHYGERALVMWKAHPSDETFRRIVLSGYHHYAPMWRDALRLGGNVAADQVRCWEILARMARLEPAEASRVADLLRAAVRSHFKGEQYGNGAWGDVTIFGFDPRADLQVGDFTGVPQNLLAGLAIAYDGELGLRTSELRAMFTTVLRSSVAEYRRPYGFLSTRSEHSGINPGGGALRFAPGLVEMLGKLKP